MLLDQNFKQLSKNAKIIVNHTYIEMFLRECISRARVTNIGSYFIKYGDHEVLGLSFLSILFFF